MQERKGRPSTCTVQSAISSLPVPIRSLAQGRPQIVQGSLPPPSSLWSDSGVGGLFFQTTVAARDGCNRSETAATHSRATLAPSTSKGAAVMSKSSLALVCVVLLGWSALAGAVDLSKPVILVAKPELRDELYGSSILVVTPLGGDQHVGFIVNRPTGVTLGRLFPEHAAAQKVIDPVYLGGPYESQ